MVPEDARIPQPSNDQMLAFAQYLAELGVDIGKIPLAGASLSGQVYGAADDALGSPFQSAWAGTALPGKQPQSLDAYRRTHAEQSFDPSHVVQMLLDPSSSQPPPAGRPMTGAPPSNLGPIDPLSGMPSSMRFDQPPGPMGQAQQPQQQAPARPMLPQGQQPGQSPNPSHVQGLHPPWAGHQFWDREAALGGYGGHFAGEESEARRLNNPAGNRKVSLGLSPQGRPIYSGLTAGNAIGPNGAALRHGVPDTENQAIYRAQLENGSRTREMKARELAASRSLAAGPMSPSGEPQDILDFFSIP